MAISTRIVVFGLLWAPALAAAQPVVRDGSNFWHVTRDPADPGVAVVSPAGQSSFRARVDAHALVRIAPGREAPEVLRDLELVRVAEVSPTLRIFRVRDGRGGDGLDLAARLRPHTGPGQPLIDAIPDWILAHRVKDIRVPPDDERYSGQWYFDRIGIEDAWRLGDGGPETTIVVIDSGCDEAHPDLVANMDQGRDVIDGDDDSTPPPGEAGSEHGTACAGLVAAATDNALGVAGACPECRVRCVRLLSGPASEIPISADIAAFQFALDVDAAVVSNSWGFVEPTPVPSMLRAIIEMLVDEGRAGLGALVLFAAGNDNRELGDAEIENVRGVITVGAVNNFDEATAFSNSGEAVDVVAPTGTLTTDISGPGGADPGDYFSSFGGTSSSCPVAAGVAGLLASAAPDQTGAQLADALISTSIPSLFATPDERGHDLLYGYGRIAPAPAMRRVLGLDLPMADGGVGSDGGAATDAGTTSPPKDDDEGCGCRVPARRSEGGPGLLAFLAIAVLWARSRSRRRTSR